MWYSNPNLRSLHLQILYFDPKQGICISYLTFFSHYSDVLYFKECQTKSFRIVERFRIFVGMHFSYQPLFTCKNLRKYTLMAEIATLRVSEKNISIGLAEAKALFLLDRLSIVFVLGTKNL